jgi:hypothetical protein
MLVYLAGLSGPIFYQNARELLKDFKFVFVMILHSPAWREERYMKSKNW